jgi:hypothetical protein
MGPAPRVVATFGQRAPAEQAAEALRKAGLDPVVVGGEQMESDRTRAFLRSFSFGPASVTFGLRDGRSVEVPTADIQLLLRGTRIRHETRTDVTTERRLSVGKAVLTGGLVMTSTRKKETAITTEEREGFLAVYAASAPDLIALETAVQYQGLGDAMQPTRSANFARLIAELRKRAPAAPYDERLITRAGQAQLLCILAPEPFLDVALTVLAATLRPTSLPYR